MNQVSADADVCPYCGYIFATGLYNQDGTAFHQYGVQITEDPEHYYCPSCSHEVSADIDICPYCGYIFATGLYNQDGTAFHTYGTEITDGSEYESTGGVPDDAMGCPNCHGTISIYTTVCPWCGYNLNGGYTGYGDIPDYDDYFDYDYDDFLDYTDYVNPIDPYSGTVDDWAGWSDDWGDWDYEGIGSW
jgi:RNA polymerase subunit RPABC4/transcription elongation factor Spt4